MVPKWFQLVKILGLLAIATFMATKRTRSPNGKRTDSAGTQHPDQRIPSKRFEGVYYRESKKRIHKGVPDRTYCYMVWDHGRKKYINVGRASKDITEEKAHKARIKALAQIHDDERIDTFSDKRRKTFDRIVTAYMDWKKAEGKHTAEDWSRYNNHLKEPLGSFPISQISLERLNKLKVEKLATLSASSVKKLFILARAAVNYAISHKLYQGENPFGGKAGFVAPKEDNKAERFLTAQEANNLLEELARRSTQLRDMAFDGIDPPPRRVIDSTASKCQK